MYNRLNPKPRGMHACKFPSIRTTLPLSLGLQSVPKSGAPVRPILCRACIVQAPHILRRR